jgi:hypothetical protein
MFQRNSRYANVPEDTLEVGGREVRYIKVRAIPEPGSQVTHVVSAGERPDHLAYRYYRDPERFWHLCDANRVMWPDDLVGEVGRAIVVPPPEA